MPAIPGVESFRGPAYHPARWPHTPVDFTGKRVGIIGTGATAIQAIPEIAQQAKQLAPFVPFEVAFTGLDRFPGTLWLAPDPVEPFRAMTAALELGGEV